MRLGAKGGHAGRGWARVGRVSAGFGCPLIVCFLVGWCSNPIRLPCRPTSVVPEAGLEPARPFGQGILSPLRLPFRHPGMGCQAQGGVCHNLGAVQSYGKAPRTGESGEPSSPWLELLICLQMQSIARVIVEMSQPLDSTNPKQAS